MDLEVLAKSSLNAIRELNGLPRVRYVEKQPETTNLWLMNDPFVIEKLPAGSVDVVNYVKANNQAGSSFNLKQMVSQLKKNSTVKTEDVAINIIEKLIGRVSIFSRQIFIPQSQ